MNEVRAVLTSVVLLALAASCATEPPPPAAPPPSNAPAPPPGSQRLPGGVTCESEIGCFSCSSDSDKAAVKMAPLVHSAELRACYDRGAKTHAGVEGRVVFRIGIDPTGAVGTSCIVRSSLNDAAIESCLADVILTWKFPPPKGGGWATVDTPFAFTR
jgi:TonB family protein